MGIRMGKVGVRLIAPAEILLTVAGLFVASALIGAFVTPLLADNLRTPVLGLAMWGGVAVGGLLLLRTGQSYASIGLTRPKKWTRCVMWAVLAYVAGLIGAIALGEVIRSQTDWAPLDVTYIRTSIQGNFTSYVTWMVLVVWGSAAFGEELLLRGFIFEKLQSLFSSKGVGLWLAVLLQAVVFGLLHAIQGPTGMVITAWIGLVLAVTYLASGRNLWAPILAHGIMDSISLTLMYLGVPLPGYIQ